MGECVRVKERESVCMCVYMCMIVDLTTPFTSQVPGLTQQQRLHQLTPPLGVGVAASLVRLLFLTVHIPQLYPSVVAGSYTQHLLGLGGKGLCVCVCMYVSEWDRGGLAVTDTQHLLGLGRKGLCVCVSDWGRGCVKGGEKNKKGSM